MAPPLWVFREHPRLPASRHCVDEDDFGGSKVNLAHPQSNRARGEATVFNRRLEFCYEERAVMNRVTP